MYDFAGNFAFLSCYLPNSIVSYEFIKALIENLRWGESQLQLDGKVTLPSVKTFHGQLKITKTDPLDIDAQYFGDPEWISMKSLESSKRIFIYAEEQLSNDDMERLKKFARELGHAVQFRTNAYAEQRLKKSKPLAFISHDSRDKEVARKIATGLERMQCPVWYDEFSLKVGDNLRQKIETGLKECKKCVLLLSKNFFSNGGWTKKEFDSVFSREILEKNEILLPVWLDVSKEDVFQYSPSLLNIKGINFSALGEDEVCRRLHRSIDDT